MAKAIPLFFIAVATLRPRPSASLRMTLQGKRLPRPGK